MKANHYVVIRRHCFDIVLCIILFYFKSFCEICSQIFEKGEMANMTANRRDNAIGSVGNWIISERGKSNDTLLSLYRKQSGEAQLKQRRAVEHY